VLHCFHKVSVNVAIFWELHHFHDIVSDGMLNSYSPINFFAYLAVNLTVLLLTVQIL